MGLTTMGIGKEKGNYITYIGKHARIVERANEDKFGLKDSDDSSACINNEI